MRHSASGIPLALVDQRDELARAPRLPYVTPEAVAADVGRALAALIEAVARTTVGTPPLETAVTDRSPGEPRRLLVGVKSAAAMIDVSVATINELIYSRQLASVKIGGRRLVPVDVLEAMVAEMTRDAHEAMAAGRVPG